MSKITSLFLVIIQLILYMFFPSIGKDVVDNRTAVKLKFDIELAEDIEIDFYERTVTKDDTMRVPDDVTVVKLILSEKQWESLYMQMLEKKYQDFGYVYDTQSKLLKDKFGVDENDMSAIYWSPGTRYELTLAFQIDRFILTTDYVNGMRTVYMIATG